MRYHSQLSITAAVLLSTFASACSDATTDARSDSVHELVVTAADFHFRANQSVPAGYTRIRLKNEGPEFHHVQLVRLEDGHTVPELLERLAAGDFAPPWATFVGGPELPPTNGESEVTLDLTAGQYTMICVISSQDGVPHVMKGMVLPLTVTPSPAANQPEPEADVRMVLDNYSFEFAPAIRPGRRTIRVENVAAQPHHVDIVRLAPGKTVHDLLAWETNRQGTPPGEPFSGTTALTRGAVNFVTAEFTPGDYALLCFVPDAGDGKPHVAHGMLRQIRVE